MALEKSCPIWLAVKILVVPLIDFVIGQTLDNHRSLLLGNYARCLGNKVLWILRELLENRRVDLTRDMRSCFSSQLRIFGQLPHEIILHKRVDGVAVFRRGSSDGEAVASPHLVVGQSIVLYTDLHPVLQWGHAQLRVKRADAVSNQLG